MAAEAGAALELANRFCETLLARGEWDDALFSSDATLWHNTDERVLSLTRAVASRSRISASHPDFAVVDVTAAAWEAGFVVEFAYTATAGCGRAVRIPACIIGTIADGRVAGVAEYLDSTALAHLDVSAGADR